MSDRRTIRFLDRADSAFRVAASRQRDGSFSETECLEGFTEAVFWAQIAAIATADRVDVSVLDRLDEMLS